MDKTSMSILVAITFITVAFNGIQLGRIESKIDSFFPTLIKKSLYIHVGGLKIKKVN